MKAAEAAAEVASRTTATDADNAVLLVVVVGSAPAPKFSVVQPGASKEAWDLAPWKLGLYGGGGGGGGGSNPPPPPPRVCTSAIFGGSGFPSPHGSPPGLCIVGTGDGRLFFFDLMASAAALGQVPHLPFPLPSPPPHAAPGQVALTSRPITPLTPSHPHSPHAAPQPSLLAQVDAHKGNPISAMCLVGASGLASGAMDGTVVAEGGLTHPRLVSACSLLFLARC